VSPTQAVRRYEPGARLSYAYEVYNASGDVRSVISIWRGAERIVTVPPSVLPPPRGGERLFAAAGGLKLGDHLPPGDYVLQVSATTADPHADNRTRAAVQRIDFTVR
jgi:hypothetical protein